MIRPRSLSRVETRLLIDGTPVSATLFDMVVYAFHNYKALVSAG
jgi:malate synthase